MVGGWGRLSGELDGLDRDRLGGYVAVNYGMFV